MSEPNINSIQQLIMKSYPKIKFLFKQNNEILEVFTSEDNCLTFSIFLIQNGK